MPALDNRGTWLGAPPGPALETSAHIGEFRAAATSLVSAGRRETWERGATSVTNGGATTIVEDGEPSIEGTMSCPTVDLSDDFALAAAEVSANFRRRISNLRRRVPRDQIGSTVIAALHWRAAAMETLKREFAAKRMAANFRGSARRVTAPDPIRRTINKRPVVAPPAPN